MIDWKKNSKIPPPNQGLRPTCSHPDCDRERAIINTKKDGSPIYRKVCPYHHNIITAQKRGLNNISEVVAVNAGFKSISDYLNNKSIQKGFKSLTEERNSKHPYRRHRKDYCENTDGRLGFVCVAVIVDVCQLDVDHIDGNPTNNSVKNLQTLCKNCHSLKTNKERDYATTGRKAIKEGQKFSRKGKRKTNLIRQSKKNLQMFA